MPRADRLDFDKIDIAGLISEILHIDWPHTFSTNDRIDSAWERLNKFIARLIADYTPIKPSCNRVFSPHKCLP